MSVLHRILIGLGCLALLSASASWAGISGVSGTTTPALLSPAQAGSVSILWQVSLTPSAGGPETVSSNAGQILAPDGSPLLNLSTVFNRTGSGVLAFTESALIPSATVQSWRDAGYSQVTIRRTFNSSAGRSVLAQISLPLAGASGTASSPLLGARTPTANLVIRNLELRFVGSLAPVEIVAPNADLRAELRIYHSGSGTLEGEWQVAEPGSTAGLPLFRPLRRVRQVLTGQQLSRLVSPSLPTGMTGSYLLRFCAIDAATVTASERAELCTTPETTVQTAYRVLSENTRTPVRIAVDTPVSNSISPATRFHWQPVDGAVVYQLQIFSQDDASPRPTFVTGMLLPSHQLETSLSAISHQHLQGGGRYLWRINALDQNGQVIGRTDEYGFIFMRD